MNWVLIIYIYAGILGVDNNFAVTHIGGFTSKESAWMLVNQQES